MRTRSRQFIGIALLLCFTSVQHLAAAAPWGGALMQRGIAALTCGGPATDSMGNPVPAANAFTFGLADFRTPPAAMYGPCNSTPSSLLTVPLWNAPMYHDPSWTVENLGNLFGITLDDAGNIYVAAHGLFGTYRPMHHRYGNLGGGATSLTAAGTVYKISATTGAATVFTVIPGQQVMTINTSFSSGPGLGNLSFHRRTQQFYISSLEDGKIYRVNAAGVIQNSFDPLTPDNGAVGMPPRGERVWAVEVLGDSVYYSIWNVGDSSSPGVIRRVDLDGAGDFIPSSDMAVMTVPPQGYVNSGGTPAVDITFTLDGQTMFVGTRTMQSDTTAYNHNSATHMAQLIGTTWTPVRTQNTGCNIPEGEAYGGVALGEEGGVQEAIIWSTSADMAVNHGPHGVYGVRVPDFPVSGKATNSFKMPYDPTFIDNTGNDRKGSGGDVEIMRVSDTCADITVGKVNCPESNGAPFTVTLNITNLGTATVHYVWMTPCPTSSLPAGAITAQPEPSGIVALPTPLPPGAGTSMQVTLPGNVGGQTVCFRLTLLDRQGKTCCTEKVCVPVPPCDCAEVIDKRVSCEPQADGTIKYNITLTIVNLTHLSANPYGIAYVSILPPTGFSPTYAIPSPNPIPPGSTGTVTLCYYGAPGPICFNLGLHDDSLEECCSPEPICIDLPDCPPGSEKPDTCAVETKVPCCPPAPGTAMINYTICNNSAVPRTYSWTATPTAAPGCSNMLLSSSFVPSSGTLGPIPPGGCMTVPINIRCEGLKPGDCAGYHICASYNATVPPLCCDGIVYRPKQGEPVAKGADPTGSGGKAIPVRGSADLTFEVQNLETTPMRLTLYIQDELGVLSFSGDGGVPMSLYSWMLDIPASSTAQTTVNARRLDDGIGMPDFTMAELWTSATGSPGTADPALIVPVRLLPPAQGTAPTIKSIQLQSTPSPQVVVTMHTVSGRRYQVEQASEVTGPWATSTCTTPDTTIEGGHILGTGGDVSCYIDCDPATTKMFFRLVERP